MGVNWDSGLIYWKDHVPSAGERYSLAHLHPFTRTLEFPATEKHAAQSLRLHIAFSLHTFTRAVTLSDSDQDLYRDNREIRTFCVERHARSFQLPHIFRTIESRRCEFARGRRGLINYVTLETKAGEHYAAFFTLRRFRKMGADAVQIMVESAYVLDPRKALPGQGRISFRALLDHTLRGTNPRPPP